MHDHHQKKFVTKIAKFIFSESTLFAIFSISSFTSSSTFFITLFIFIEFILFATLFETSKKLIFWAKMTSKSITSSKSSRLSLSILEFFRNAFRIALISSSNIASIFASSSTRFYMTINDLFVMFNEKSKSLNLSHRQKHTFSQHYWRLNKFFISRQTQITSYFLSSLNSFKFNILSKSNFCLFIQTSVFRRIFLCEQNINFASRRSFFNHFYCFSHICRRCKQAFESKNQFHEHFRYCKKSFKHQIVAWNVVALWRTLEFSISFCINTL